MRASVYFAHNLPKNDDEDEEDEDEEAEVENAIVFNRPLLLVAPVRNSDGWNVIGIDVAILFLTSVVVRSFIAIIVTLL